jgi:hypothetical protein
VAAATSVALSHAVLLTRDTGTYRDAEEASLLLRRVLQPGDRVLVELPSSAPLAYYFDRLRMPSTYLSLDERSAKRIVVIVNRGEGQTLASVAGRSEVRDSTRFAPTAVVTTLPTSTLLMFQRRDAATK